MYDAIIVGARIAGSSTALHLAKKGYRVLLLDRDSFPSDTISTHIVFTQGCARLQRWGLYDKIKESNAPVIREMTMNHGDGVILRGTPPPVNGNSDIIAPRRIILDKILIDAAVEAGAELRENCSVEEVLMHDNVVTGVRCRTKNGVEFTEHARIVIGADGRHSIVARAVKAEEYHQHPKLTCWYYTYWSNVPEEALSMTLGNYRAVGMIPTNDNLVCIPVTWPIAEFTSFRSDIEGNYMKTIKSLGLADIMQDARREAPFTGMADLPNFFRKPFGPGWALIGDAAYHKDPMTGQGITDALVYSEVLADAIDDGFSGRKNLDQALQEYQHIRDEEVMPMYQFSCEWATLSPPKPEQSYLFSVLANNQEEMNQFFGVACGTVPITTFFSPENIGRILGMASV